MSTRNTKTVIVSRPWSLNYSFLNNDSYEPSDRANVRSKEDVGFGACYHTARFAYSRHGAAALMLIKFTRT